MKRATALRYARETDHTAAQPEQRSQAKGEHPMLIGITVPTGATKDTRVWVVNRYHNRITTRKIGSDIISFGSFPPDIVSVTTTKGEAIKAMLECRAAELNNAIREMARAERAMVSALKLASKEGHADPQSSHKKRRIHAMGLWPQALPLQQFSTGDDFERTLKNRT